jgi:hypothetical protein
MRKWDGEMLVMLMGQRVEMLVERDESDWTMNKEKMVWKDSEIRSKK